MGPIRALGLRALCTGGYEASRTSLCIGTCVVCASVFPRPTLLYVPSPCEGKRDATSRSTKSKYSADGPPHIKGRTKLGKNERLILHALELARQESR